MNTDPGNRPGIREQHLLRKRDNPLFEPDNQISNEDLMQARLEDGVERDECLRRFQSLVQEAIELQPNAASETVLELKERLDQCYQQVCGLPGDVRELQQALKKLLGVIMNAVRTGAGNDAFAQRQLQEEELARAAHFELQELPLVAALMHEQSPVAERDLIPTLLSEPDASLTAALAIFDQNQLAAICHDAGEFLRRRDPAAHWSDAWRRLALIEDHYRDLQPPSPMN